MYFTCEGCHTQTTIWDPGVAMDWLDLHEHHGGMLWCSKSPNDLGDRTRLQ